MIPGFIWVGRDLVNCLGDEAHDVVGVVVKLRRFVRIVPLIRALSYLPLCLVGSR